MDITQALQPIYNVAYIVIGASAMAALFAYSCKPALNAHFNQRESKKMFKFIWGISELAFLLILAQIFLRP